MRRLLASSASLLVVGSLVACMTETAGSPEETESNASAVQVSGSAVSVSTTALAFGDVSCGTTAAAKTVVVTNTGKSAITYQATLALGGRSPYTVSPASGTVAANGKATVTVTPEAIPARNLATEVFDDTLTVKTNASGDTAHTVALTETASGAMLYLLDATGVPQPTIAIVSSPVRGNSPVSTNLENVGNAAEAVSYVVVASPSNANPSTSLLSVTFSGTANVGPNTVTYGLTGSGGLPCNTPLSYTVTFPAKTTNGVYVGATQTVTAYADDGC
jgi:hypothetical protein